MFNPPLTSFDTLSDSYAKQLVPPPTAASCLAGTDAAGSLAEDSSNLNLGTPDCVDLPITVLNRVLLLRTARSVR